MKVIGIDPGIYGAIDLLDGKGVLNQWTMLLRTKIKNKISREGKVSKKKIKDIDNEELDTI